MKNHKEVILTEQEFEKQYPLLPNHLNPNASWATGNGRGCLFETFGEEREFVRQQDPRTIWTLIEGEDGDLILSGYWSVNRIGYLVSTVPVPERTEIEVLIPRDSDDDDIEDYIETDKEV